MALFGGGIPAEDQDAKRLREAEQARAERERIKATQEQLSLETQNSGPDLGIGALSRRRGLKSLLGSG